MGGRNRPRQHNSAQAAEAASASGRRSPPHSHRFAMAYSRAVNQRTLAFEGRVHKRGSSHVKKEGSRRVGPVLIGFFLFVVVGSAVLQIVSTATAAKTF